nr:hypothetical protein [Tanacetum cinerariifolium]
MDGNILPKRKGIPTLNDISNGDQVMPKRMGRPPLNDISNDDQVMPKRRGRPPLSNMSNDVQVLLKRTEDEAYNSGYDNMFNGTSIDAENEFVKSYRMVRDRHESNQLQNVRLRLIGRRQSDGREYNLPTASEVEALIVGDIAQSLDERDIRIDDFISAEIPDEEADPELYKFVGDHMMHGHCRPDNPSCPCTIKGKCTKKFPKTYSERTSTDFYGYPVYKRRDDDNNQTENENDDEVVDEINDYYDCRYLSSCEACWRILGNKIHYRFLAVERLPFHLLGQQQVVYEDDDDISDAINKLSVSSLKFLGWMECNKTNDLAKTLTYVEFPTKFVWKAEEKVWQERKRGYAIGRIHYVPPLIGEAYYLRILLHKQKGPEDWDKIMEACGEYVRKEFARLFTSNIVSRPDLVWNETWRLMCDDIKYEQHKLLNYPVMGVALIVSSGMPLPDMEFIRNHTNILIHDELCYNKDELVTEHETLFSNLTSEQKNVYTKGKRMSGEFYPLPYVLKDEAPMMHKHCFESLDRTLRDILRIKNKNAQNIPFGGKVIVFGEDFRQILPVIPGGDGKLGGPNDGEAVIGIPDDLLIKDSHDPVGSLVQSVYPSFLDNLNDATYFQERAILAPTHEVVEVINDHLLDLIPSKEKVYYSSDSICESEGLDDNFNESLYSPNVSNGLKLSGIPNHRLALKVGAPVMLLRNIDQSAGLCNGTRLRITKLGERCIEAEIITETKVGEKVILTRMKLSPSDKRIPFKINRREFPIFVCFAMTINKSQGQSLSNVGIFLLPKPMFTHGQLYVDVSRVKSRKGLKVLMYDKEGNVCNTTMNVVYHECL